ncbi:hypothetical protein [Pseudomonas sp. CBC3]|uniref:hypothetical protein n=1 Tax=Pseudomonas sp. CBC3 TaxID=3123318 RepID=UPI0030E84D84
MRKAARLAGKFPLQVNLGAIRLFTAQAPSTELKAALQRAFRELASNNRSRSTLEVQHPENRLFIKSSRLTGFQSRLRTTLGIERRKGGLDWEVAELLNTIRAEELQAPTARLLGFAYRKQLGLVSNVSLIFEFLEHYLPSHQWLGQQDPVPFLRNCFTLFRELHEKRIYHLDLWAGNVMINSRHETLRVIDFENCLHGATEHEPEVLGFMYGHFFQREINQYVDEPTYDRLVDEVMPKLCIDPARFRHTYVISKHEKIGRKERRLLHSHGVLVTG